MSPSLSDGVIDGALLDAVESSKFADTIMVWQSFFRTHPGLFKTCNGRRYWHFQLLSAKQTCLVVCNLQNRLAGAGTIIYFGKTDKGLARCGQLWKLNNNSWWRLLVLAWRPVAAASSLECWTNGHRKTYDIEANETSLTTPATQRSFVQLRTTANWQEK